MAIELSEKQIKDGWQIVRFGEIAKEVKSTTKDPAEDGLEFYVGLEHLDPQSLRIARKGSIAEDNPSFTRRFSSGQILFGKRRCYQKKAAVADFEGICSGDIIVMEATPRKIIPGLLPFIIQSDTFFDWAEKTSSGSLSPRTKWKSLAEFEFPLPPTSRQEEILEVLEKLEECSNALSESRESGDLLFASIKNKVEMRLGAENIELKKICKLYSGGTPSRSEKRYYHGDIPWLKSGEVNNLYINSTEEFISSEALENSSAKWVKKGNPVLAMYGATAGKVAWLEIDVTINQAICAVMPDETKARSLYVFYALRATIPDLLNKLQGSGQPNLSGTIIKQHKIPLPSLKMQDKVSQAYLELDKEISRLNKKYNELQELRSSIFSFWFSSEGGAQ